MPVRASTSELRAWVRRLISDPAGADQRLSEQEIQDLLDERRASLVQEPLEAVERRASGGATQRRIWKAVGGDWEGGVTLEDENFTTISPTASDLYLGRWTFADDYEHVYVSGELHDVYGAAAAALRVFASLTAPDFDLRSGDDDLKLSQPTTQFLALAAEYETRSAKWPGARYRDRTLECGPITYTDFTENYNRRGLL